MLTMANSFADHPSILRGNIIDCSSARALFRSNLTYLTVSDQTIGAKAPFSICLQEGTRGLQLLHPFISDAAIPQELHEKTSNRVGPAGSGLTVSKLNVQYYVGRG